MKNLCNCRRGTQEARKSWKYTKPIPCYQSSSGERNDNCVNSTVNWRNISCLDRQCPQFMSSLETAKSRNSSMNYYHRQAIQHARERFERTFLSLDMLPTNSVRYSPRAVRVMMAVRLAMTAETNVTVDSRCFYEESLKDGMPCIVE